MIRRPCLTCGQLTTRGSYCRKHEPPRTAPTSVDRIHWRKAQAARRRDGERCVRCGSTDRVEVHHLLPVSKGGSHDESNLVSLCTDCHRRLHS